MHSNVSCVCNHILSMIAAIQIARHRILYTTENSAVKGIFDPFYSLGGILSWICCLI